MFPIEAFEITLGKLITILERHKIRFHLTGGLTGIAYGEPRMTQDIDVVIDPIATRQQADSMIDSLAQSDFMFSEEVTRRAIVSGNLF
ncbi:MAG: hypothetical protein MI861_18265, partial [Pirellulales bacterium]|nr:hypothetical protein [Pirellulales bacterium]